MLTTESSQHLSSSVNDYYRIKLENNITGRALVEMEVLFIVSRRMERKLIFLLGNLETGKK